MQQQTNWKDLLLRRAYDVGIATKIIVPFVVLAIVLAGLGGYLLTGWVVQLLNTTAEEQIVLSRDAANTAFAHSEQMIMTNVRTMASAPDVTSHVQNRQLGDLRAHLLPMMISFDNDFYEVLDGTGKVILNNNGPYPESSDLSWMPMVKGARVDMTMVDLVSSPSGEIIAGIAPSKSATGPTGFVILGNYFTNSYLREIKELVGRDISVFTKDGLIATTKEGRLNTTCLVSGCHTTGYTSLISSKILKGTAQRIEYANMLGESYLVTHGALNMHGQPVAFYSILMPLDSVLKTQSAIRGIIMLASLLLVIIITTLGYMIGKSISEPLYDLSIMARQIMRGDLTRRAHYLGVKDEVGELTSALNQMTESLQRYTRNLRRRVQELSALYDTSVNTSSIYDVNGLLQSTVDNAAHVLNADCGSILLSDEKQETLTLMAAYAAPESLIGNLSLDINSERSFLVVKSDAPNPEQLEAIQKKLTLAIRGLKKATPMLIDRDHADDDEKALLADTKLVSVIAIPLRVHNVLGVLQIGRNETKTPFTDEDRDFMITLANQAAAFIENRMLIQNLRESYISTVRALAEAIDAKDHYTRGHSTRVAKYAVAIAKEMKLPQPEIEGIETAAYLHDVGKIGISDQILQKPDRLTADELETIKSHPIISARILAPINFPWEIIPIVSQHHERFGGGGYPNQLSREQIHIGARILIVADSYEAMTADRPYRPALSHKAALDELKKGSGGQFDPALVDIFLKVLAREKRNHGRNGGNHAKQKARSPKDAEPL